MSIKTTFTAGLTAVALAASTTFVMAQATGTKNNEAATPSGSGTETTGKGSTEKSGSTEKETPTSAGTSGNQAKDLPGHSETPKTGK